MQEIKDGDRRLRFSHTYGVTSYSDDPAAYEQLLKAKLRPENIRATLLLATLFQMLHEMLKRSILEQVRDFFVTGFDETGCTYSESYKRHVLDRAPRDKFRASSLWLVEMSAITNEQADRIGDIYKHRHSVTHELMKYVIDPEHSIDIELFLEAMNILKSIKRFWIECEAGISFDADVDLDEVVPLDLMMMQQCIDSVVEALMSTQPEGS